MAPMIILKKIQLSKKLKYISFQKIEFQPYFVDMIIQSLNINNTIWLLWGIINGFSKKYFIDYYFNNLSLAEISENENVSRNAVSKDLKLTKEKLINYEEKLKLYDKDKKIRKVIDKITDNSIKEELEKILDE